MGELSNTTINGVSYDFKDAGAARQSHSHTKSQITDFPTSMPASDVSAWAKASSKPSYTASEVGAIAATAKGAASGVAELDANGKVPSSQLSSPPSGFTKFNTLPGCQITDKLYETGGFVMYGPMAFIMDDFIVPSGTTQLQIFSINWQPNSPYPESLLPPIPIELYPEYNNERSILHLPVYDTSTCNIRSDCYLELYYNYSWEPTDPFGIYFANLIFNTATTSTQSVMLRLNYIGKQPTIHP